MTPSQIQTLKKKEELRTRGKTTSADSLNDNDQRPRNPHRIRTE